MNLVKFFLNFKKPLLIAGAVAALSGCKEFKGQIEVLETLQLGTVKGSGKGIIAPGVYGAKIDFPERGKVRLEINMRGKDNNPRSYFRLGGNYFPKYSGPIDIPAAQNGQGYDIVGDLQTDVDESREQRSSESCSFTVQRRVCHRDVEGRPVCSIQSDLISGRQDIRFFDRTTRQFLRLDLEDPSSGRVVARTNGRHAESERIVTHRGRCLDLSGRDPRWYDDRDDGYGRDDRYGRDRLPRPGRDRIPSPGRDDSRGRGDRFDRDGDGLCDRIVIDARGRKQCVAN